MPLRSPFPSEPCEEPAYRVPPGNGVLRRPFALGDRVQLVLAFADGVVLEWLRRWSLSHGRLLGSVSEQVNRHARPCPVGPSRRYALARIRAMGSGSPFSVAPQ